MAPPPAVANFRVTSVNYRQIGMAWNLYSPTSTIDRFYLYIGLTAGDRSNRATLSNTTNVYTNTYYPFGSSNPWMVPGTLYYLTIVGNSTANGSSPEVQLTATTTVMAAPTGFISSALSDTTVNTNWTVYPGAARINYLNYIYNDFNPPTSVTTIDRFLTSYNLSGLTPNTRYYINLSAVIDQGPTFTKYTSPPATLELVTYASPPIGPLGFSPSTPTTISMTWTNPVAPPTHILLAISTTPGVFTNSVTLEPNMIGYVWTGLIPSTTYYFRVQNSNQNDILTSSITGSMATIDVPPIVSVLFTNITASGFRANFVYDETSPPDVIGWRIGVGVPPVGPYTYTENLPNEMDFNGEEDLYYYLEVVARIGETDSTVVFATVYTSNAIPSNFTPIAAPTETTINMGWDPSFSPTTGYQIWISETDTVWGDPITLGIVNTYDFTGLDPATTYYFKLIDLGSIDPSGPAYSIAITASEPIANSNNYLMYIYKATDGFKHSPHSLKRSLGRPIFRQIRGGW